MVASIGSQFEMVSEEWATNRSFQGLFDSEDAVLGHGTMVIQAQPARSRIADRPSFVRTKGGGYFFVPSLTALRFVRSL